MSCYFSIIIPTCNASSTINTAVASVINQSFINFEIVIIDAVSSDDTLQILNKYADNRIKIICEKDKGVYDAMNKAVEIAEGEYLYFLGSDDFLYDNNVLQNIFNFSKVNHSDVLYGSVIFSSNRSIYAGEFTLERLLFTQNICHQAIFYNKECFKKLGNYNLKYYLLADWDFNIRCFMHPSFKINFIDTIIAVYNDSTGLSKDNGEADKIFMNISPHYRMRNLLAELSNIKFSKEYGLGRKIYNPLKKIQKIFSK